MIFLLDTHTFIWSVLGTGKLSRKARDAILDKNNIICVSVVSFWEISLKSCLGKFSFNNININDFPKYARDMGFKIIDLKEYETITFHELPLKAKHKDPFDRMLIWQSIKNNMILISKDEAVHLYKDDGLKSLW